MENMVVITFKLESLQKLFSVLTSKISVVVGMCISNFHACQP